MNKTTNHYFKNLFVRRKKLLMLYMFICFIAYPFLLVLNSVVYHEKLWDLLYLSQVMLGFALIVLGIFAFVLPIFTFKFTLVKKNVDTYYALPINRRHMFKAHYIAPIIGVIVPLFVNFVLGALFLLIRGASISTVMSYTIVLLVAFVFFITIYSINCFFVLRCNNVVDACLVSAAIFILPYFVGMAVEMFMDSQIVRNGMISLFDLPMQVVELLNPYMSLVYCFQMVDMDKMNQIFLTFEYVNIFYLFYYPLLGVLGFVGAYQTFRKKKGEDAEQITTSFVIYPLFIHVAMFSFILMFNLVSMHITMAILSVIGLFLLYVVANSIAHRSFKIKKSTVLTYVALILVVNGFNYISRQTEFFGINRKVIDYTQYDELVFELRCDILDENDEDYQVVVDVAHMDEEDQKLVDYIEVLQRDMSSEFKKSGMSSYGPDLLIVQYTIHEGEHDYYNSVRFDISEKTSSLIKDMFERVDE